MLSKNNKKIINLKDAIIGYTGYVGSFIKSKKKNVKIYNSKNINKRFCVHRCKLKNSCHDNIFLQRAYNFDGEDKFILDFLQKAKLD